MAPAILSILMSIIAIIGAYVMVIYLRKYGNIERMAMIEKGLDPKLFAVEKKPLNTSWSLRFALLLIGAGAGLLLGHFLDRYIMTWKKLPISQCFLFVAVLD